MVYQRTFIASSCLWAAICVLPARVCAQDISGRVQLSAQVNLLSAFYTTGSGQAPKSYGFNVGGSGNGVLSASPPLLGVGIGYALDQHWVPSVSFRISHTEYPGSPVAGFTSWSVNPGLRYVFAQGHKVRPFFGGGLLFGRSSSTVDSTLIGGDLITGMQLHLVERLSFDPFAMLVYGYQHQPAENNASARSPESTSHSISLVGGFALSLWL